MNSSTEPADDGTAAIRAEIAATRAELANTVDQLSDKLDVKAQAQHKVDDLKSNVTQAAHRAKDNPNRALIGAAGGLLLVVVIVLRRRARS